MSCKRIDDVPQILPGWGCCQCHVYNGYQRSSCRSCGHPHCYAFEPGDLLPIYDPDGKIRSHHDPATRSARPVVGSP
jgi:hypothetical protein